jgi:hypothetical protein
VRAGDDGVAGAARVEGPGLVSHDRRRVPAPIWFRRLVDERREIIEAIAEARGVTFEAVIDELSEFLVRHLIAEYTRRGWPLPNLHRRRRGKERR